MIFYWIFRNILLIVIYTTFAFLSAIIVPKHCYDVDSVWTCNINSNSDQINCKTLADISYSPRRIIELNIKSIDIDRHLMLFEGADKCNIFRLKVVTNQIPPNKVIYNLNALELLIIQGSQGQTSEKSISVANNLLNGLDKLDKIKIEDFKINLWNKEIFQSCTSVTDIELKSLEIELIDFQSFVNCKKLTTLTIKINKISKISISSFDGLVELTRLLLPSNQITLILTNGRSWNSLNKLKELDLSDNKISELSGKLFFGLKLLEKLIFKNNELKSISTDTFLGLSELTILDLRNNPRLISLDLNALNPVRVTLTHLLIYGGNIQCLHDKQFLRDYRNGVKEVLQSIVSCTFDKVTEFIATTTLSSSEIHSNAHKRPDTTLSSHQLTLIITVTILSTVICFLAFFFLYYCIVTKSKMRKYKLNSQTNSVRYSRNGIYTPYLTEIPSPPGTNYQRSDDIYAQFVPQTISRNDTYRSHMSMPNM